MSVWIYKDGEESLVPPHRLQAHLDIGWSVDKDAEPESEDSEMSNSDVRQMAKQLGIEGWDTKRVGKLKEAIAEHE